MKNLMDLHDGSLMLLGPTMDPKAAFSISMRLPHLGMRMERCFNLSQFYADPSNLDLIVGSAQEFNRTVVPALTRGDTVAECVSAV